jgi:hypothetical protein
MGDIMSRMTAADLPNEDVEFLADIIGMDAVLKLLVSAKGLSFYIPNRLSPEFCRKYILANFTPREPNTKALARTLGCTERNVWRVLKGARPPRRAAA